jgi:hypothetical protein
MRIGWAGHMARMGERTGVCMVVVGRPLGKRPLRKLGSRWEEFIKIDLQ